MERKKKDQIEWLEFEQLKEFPEILQGVFLRKGGYSEPPFASLNVGDEGEDPMVQKNEQKILSILGIQKVFSPGICHGADLEIIESERKTGKLTDGVFTKTAELGLLVTHADCQAALFYDPIHKVIGNVHCGWRGNVQNIYGRTVEFLQKHFGTNPKDLLVCISPSLGPNKAEFINYKQELPEHFWPFQVRPTYFDLWEISKTQLLDAKIKEGHIEIAKICTYENEKDFFSYRREKKTGRNATLVAMRKI